MKRYLFAMMLLAACGGDEEPDTQAMTPEQQRELCETWCVPNIDIEHNIQTNEVRLACTHYQYEGTCPNCQPTCPDGSMMHSPRNDGSRWVATCGTETVVLGSGATCDYTGPETAQIATQVEGSWTE